MCIDNSDISNKALLTIAIPTFNRAAYLDICLKRISEELNCLDSERQKLVRVYVSNNASTDKTTQVISQYQFMKAGEFESVTNVENIGGERNVSQCYTSATTPYVWVLGDDDVILPGGLQIILDKVATREIDILYVNGYSFTENYLDEPKRGSGKSGIVEYTTALDFVRHTHVMLTFITALIVRSGVKVEAVGHVVNGSNLPQLGWILPLIRDGNKFAFIKDRIYAAKIGNSGGYGAIQVFGNNLSTIANSIFRNQPKMANAIQNGTIVMWFPTYIMNLRQGKTEHFKEDVAIDMKRVFNRNWRYYFFLVPLISLPMKLARPYYLLVRLTRRLLRYVLI